jgi:tetratricopeptide (TPR) repeat protein
MRPFKSGGTHDRRWRPVVPALLLVLSVGAVHGCSRVETWRANRAFEEGGRLAREHKSAEALTKFDEAITLQRDHLPARLARAKALQDLKRHEEAIAEFDIVLRVDPQSAAALEGRGSSKEARRVGSGLDDLNAALRASGAAPNQIPLVITGVPRIMLGDAVPGDGSPAARVLQGGSATVPELGSYFKEVLQRQRKGRVSPLKQLMDKLDQASPPAKSAPPPVDLTPILDWADMSVDELEAKSNKLFDEIERAAPRAEVDKAMEKIGGIADFLNAGKKDPTRPATSLEWSYHFDTSAFLADFYNLPLVAYFPGLTDWKPGLKDLGALMPIANKAYFYTANPGFQPTRDEVARTTEMFGVTSHPTIIVVTLKSPVLGGPKKEHLARQVTCEGRPVRDCVQQVLAWFNATSAK